jgi:hypothetical protein
MKLNLYSLTSFITLIYVLIFHISGYSCSKFTSDLLDSEEINKSLSIDATDVDTNKQIIYLEDTVFIASKNCSTKGMLLTLPKKQEYFKIGELNSWQYLLINVLTGDTIQYSYNYLPTPITGKQGKMEKDGFMTKNYGNIKVLEPMKVGRYLCIRDFNLKNGISVEMIQIVFIKDIVPPTPVLVDIATAVINEGKVELIASWFDKGGCGEGCVASFDNCTDKEFLIYTFTNKLPDIENNPKEYVSQLMTNNKIFYNPNDGSIMNENDYMRGIAHAWIPSEGTSSRIFLAEKMNRDITQYKIKVYVWDEYSTDENFGDKNFNFGEVTIIFNF